MTNSNKGSFKRFLELASKMRIETAIKEMIDNSIDAKATNIDVTLDAERSKFSIVDNGRGMTLEQLRNFRENYQAHMPSSGNTIGKFGIGLKDAIIALSNYEIGANVYVKSAVDKENVCRYQFEINEKKESAWNDTPQVEGPYAEKNWNAADKDSGKEWSSESGHRVTIDGIKPIPVSNRQWHSNLSKSVATAYPYLVEKSGIKIKINGKLAECIDRMYLKHLCDDVYNADCGTHFKDGLVFWVKVYKLTNKFDKNDVRKIKVVFLYISQEADKIIGDASFDCSGMYSMYRGRYLDFANKKLGIADLTTTDTKRGGCGRFRALILIDGNEDILAIDDNKESINLGNGKLDKYGYGANNNVHFVDAFKGDFSKLARLNLYQSQGTFGKFNRPLTNDVIKSLVLEEKNNLNKLIASYIPQNVTETEVENESNDNELEVALAPTTIVEKKNDETKTAHSPVSATLKKTLKEVEAKKEENVIEYHKNKTTGATEFAITEFKPSSTSDKMLTALAKTLLKYSGKKLNLDVQRDIVNEFSHEFAK